jgi:hypothetical protein
MYVNELKIDKQFKYNSQGNAAGDTVVDLINSKRNIDVGIIPLDEEAMATLLNDIDSFNVSISFLNPRTKQLEENVSCIIPSTNVEYYTIQQGNILYKAFSLKFNEL